ncbi:hypothetical protein ACO0QE_001355 [Hanseniaspora vineae]
MFTQNCKPKYFKTANLLLILFFSLVGRTAVAAAVASSSADYLSACRFPSSYSLSNGFDLKFYYYPQWSSQYTDPDFYVSEYSTYSYLGQGKNVETLTYTNYWTKQNAYSTSLPGYFGYSGASFDSDHFTMVGTGYFKATVSGIYTFQLNWADDYSLISFGADNAFPCCQQQNGHLSTPYSDYTVSNNYANNGQKKTLQVNLLAGRNYPIRVMYVNIIQLATFSFQFMIPGETTYRTDFTGDNRDKHGEQPNINGKETDTTIYYVNTPIVFTSTTVFTPANVQSTTTYSITVVTATGIDGKETDKTIIYVETPIVTVYSTLCTPYSGSVNVTYTTSYANTTGTDGKETDSTIYYVSTPLSSGNQSSIPSFNLVQLQTLRFFSTTESFYNGSDTITYSTSCTTVIGTDSFETDSTVYYVNIPKSHKSLTSFSPANIESTLTYSTTMFLSSGSDGMETDFTIYYVASPIVTIDSTVVTAYSGLINITYSTSYVNITGSDGKQTDSTYNNNYYNSQDTLTASLNASNASSFPSFSGLLLSSSEVGFGKPDIINSFFDFHFKSVHHRSFVQVFQSKR